MNSVSITDILALISETVTAGGTWLTSAASAVTNLTPDSFSARANTL